MSHFSVDKNSDFGIFASVPFLPMTILIIHWGVPSDKNLSEVFGRICELCDFETIPDKDSGAYIVDNLKKLDRKLEAAGIEVKALIRSEKTNYTEYLSDLAIMHQFHGRHFWPSDILWHKFVSGFKGQIYIRKKATFFTPESEFMLGLTKVPLDNPMPGFEKKIFVSWISPAPLQELINTDVQDFLMKEYGNYPFKQMDLPFDGIYINENGVFYIVRRTVKDAEIRKFLMFGQKFTSMIRGLLEV